MRHINDVYTQRFNRRYHKAGQLFRGRYKAVLVEGASHLLEVMRYIHRNPMNAGLATHLDEYLWSSHVGYLSSAKTWHWIFNEPLLAMLTSKKVREKETYLDYVSQVEPQEITAFYAMKKLSSMMGGDAFKEWVKNRFSHLELQKETPEAQALAVTPQEIIAQVCAYFKLDEAVLKHARRGIENQPRDIAIYLSRCYSRKTLVDIGGAFGISNYSTVGSAVERIKIRMNHDSSLREVVEYIAKLATKSQRQT
jgi:hypothetical protein